MLAAASKKRYRPGHERSCVKLAVPRSWPGETVIAIACGASLTRAQVNTARDAWAERRARVVGVNQAYLAAPWMDLIYAGDAQWWHTYIEEVRGTYIPVLMTNDEHCAERYGLWYVECLNTVHGHEGLSEDRQAIHSGYHSGFQLLNIIYHLGCSRLLLLGFDCKLTGKQRHWWGDYPDPTMNKAPNYAEWSHQHDKAAEQFKAAGIEVVNCSPGSAINAYRCSTIGREI